VLGGFSQGAVMSWALGLGRGAAKRPTAIVALSGFTADRTAEPVIACGATAYLEKGVELSEVAATIRDVYAAAA